MTAGTSNPMTDERLAEIRERLAATTPGPWHTHDYGSPADEEPTARVVHTGNFDWDAITYDGDYVVMLDSESRDDADFIAHAPTDIAALLAEVNRLRGELDRRNAFDALRAFDEAHPELSDD